MKFGRDEEFSIILHPVEPNWERRSQTDRGPWAELGIFVNGLCLTRATEPGSQLVRDFVRVPLVPIAEWLVSNLRAIAWEESPAGMRRDGSLHQILAAWNEAEPPSGTDSDQWDDARYGWYQRHFLLAGAEGSRLPDIALARVDGSLSVSWQPASFNGGRPLEFISPAGTALTPWETALDSIREFIKYVARECTQRQMHGLGFQSNEDPVHAALDCPASDYLELVAPGFSSVIKEALGVSDGEPAARRPSLLAVKDVLLSASNLSVLGPLAKLDHVVSSQSRTHLALADVRAELGRLASGLRPEQAGYDAADWLRGRHGLNGEPLSDHGLESLCGSIAQVEETGPSPGNRALIGAKIDGGAAVLLTLAEAESRPWVRRMELARAICHLLTDHFSEGGALGAASSRAAVGYRRRRSGAFAAQFLCPDSGIRKIASGRSPGSSEVFREVLETYRVGARTAAYQMWNHGMLAFEQERDELVEEFAHQTPA